MLLSMFLVFITVTSASYPYRRYHVRRSAPAKPPRCPVGCRPTCRVPIPKNCYVNPDCNSCGSGKIWDEDKRQCVLIKDCPRGIGCNGDPNSSIKEYPPACPSTCESPEESPCKKMGLVVGCVCNYHYILSEVDGRCIKPDHCSHGHPCGVNGTLHHCKLDCHTEFCPRHHHHAMMVCDQPRYCRSGCICKREHVWRSNEDRTCILPQECPPIPCPGPYEKWDPCPSPCFAENCNELNLPIKKCLAAEKEKFRCEPRCVCKPGYMRETKFFTCIPGEQCREPPTSPSSSGCYPDSPSSSPSPTTPCGGDSKNSKCPKRCRPSCTVPNPRNCEDSRNCTYCGADKVWSDDKKQCVDVDQCPDEQGCNGDINASIRSNPWACPPTCQAPNMALCKKLAPPYGCECNTGYIYSEEYGYCVEPDKCPGGNPCGENETYACCNLECTSSFCPENDGLQDYCYQDPLATRCAPGCVCKHEFVWRSRQDRTCIRAEKCPPVKCTRPNEEWDCCPPPCFSDSCYQVTCHETTICLEEENPKCRPRCRCKADYARDYCNNTCIPAKCCPRRPRKLS